MNPLILIACFTPLAAIFVVMKVAGCPLLVEKQIMSEKNLYANEDPVGNPYADVDEEEEEYGDRTDYR